jgi:NADPH:quinone reductase-like Zn-dependent oxidoreductase/NAD(P)-dependent dehydrogenase (short-subunit alcohol dehydrogenase family)/aryl carrier-like protein
MTNRENLVEPYIFGLLPGLSQDASPESAMNDSPLLAESEWGNILTETGFSGLETCISDAGFITEHAVSAVIISKSLEPPSAFRTPLYVIHDEAYARQMELLQHVTERMLSDGSIYIVPVSWHAIPEQDLGQSHCLFLVDLDGDLLGRTQQDDLGKLKRIVSETSTLVWPTFQSSTEDQSPIGGLVTGLARTLATENENCRIVSIALEASSTTLSVVDNIINVVSHCLQVSGIIEDEYVERDGLLHIPRVVQDSDMSAQVFSTELTVTKPWSDLNSPHLTIGKVGRLNTLHFEQAKSHDTPLGVDDILIEVKAVGLSDRDILVAQGQVYDEVFGCGFAGLVSRTHPSSTHGLQTGDRVFGIGRDTLAQTIRCKPFQLQMIPADMDFCDAASYPVAYCTAHYSLVQCARIKKEDTVLIHCAADEIGQAALQIAQLHDCEVFLTVDSVEQTTFLYESYGIPRSHILSSTSLDLGIGIRRLTSGRGVDVVVNSLVGEAARESWDCLAPFGRFINVGDSAFVTELPMGKSRMFVDINIHDSAQDRSFREVFGNVHQLIESKKLKSLNRLHVFHQNNVIAAFRGLQHGDYTGRIVIKMASDEPVEMVLVSESKSLFDPRSSYLLAGGFGGIGQSTARWMVQNGATSLILPSRTLVEGSGSVREELVLELRAQGADVRAPLCDIADRVQLEKTLQDLSDMPPIKGCIQAAMVMRDSSFANMTIDDWHASLAPKLAGSWNLHQLLPSDLDFFIMFSSSTGIMGSFGQSNYTAGNTFQDALAAHRVRHGQRAHAIAMSMVVGAGWVAENAQVQALLRVRGMVEEVSLDDIYELLRFCCNAESASVGSQIITSLSLPADLRALGIVAPLGSTRPIYSHMDNLPSRFDVSADSTNVQGTKKLPSVLLQDATTLVEAADIITEAIQTQLSSLLVVSKDDIDPKKPIHKYGVDSMVAVEMRNWFSKGVGVDVGTTEILDDTGIAELAARVAKKSRFVKEDLKL